LTSIARINSQPTMEATNKINIGFLAPQTSNDPHFANFRELLPAEVSLTIEGRSSERHSRYALAGITDEMVTRAVEFVRKYQVDGLMIAGAPVTMLNPDLKRRVGTAVPVPVVASVSASTAALKALSAKRLILMTPFDAEMNLKITTHLNAEGLTVLSCPLFEDFKSGSPSKILPDELFHRVENNLREHSSADAIYFQGAALDPLPIIEKLENRFGVSVVASNPAMLWHLVSLLGSTCSITGYGKLLSSWPDMSQRTR
jgi:maleate isomerase